MAINFEIGVKFSVHGKYRQKASCVANCVTVEMLGTFLAPGSVN
jgi:hypothetical protein